MILLDKPMLPPPPSYEEIVSSWRYQAPPAFRPAATITASQIKLDGLPSHILLKIVYSTFPLADGQYESKLELQRENLFWLETSLRLVNRAFFITSMHILRSTYLAAYEGLVRPPYTSDPFHSASHGNRELPVLDLFIALLAHEDLFLDATTLHLPREEAYKDLFDLVQPRSRLEDLVKQEGIKLGVVVEEEASEEQVRSTPEPEPERPIAPTPPTSVTPTASPTKSSFNPLHLVSAYRDRKKPPAPTPFICDPVASGSGSSYRITPISSKSLTISFSPRSVKLLYSDLGASSNTAESNAFGGSTFGSLSLSGVSHGAWKKKALVEIGRTKEESLESTARKIALELRTVLAEGSL
ncbi:hypothetical protein C8J56DRAFT_955142 [Mycena floridula]|nr:hypothetical protein C8J56DRAFT_955142 [Mycena floridula]